MQVKDIISKLNDFTIINKEVTYKEKKAHILGYTCDEEIKIHVMYKDKNPMVDHMYPMHETNREQLLSSIESNINHLSIKEFIIDGKTYNVSGSSGSPTSLNNYQAITKLQYFYDLGLLPDYLMDASAEDIHISEYTVESDHLEVNEMSDIEITLRKSHTTHPFDEGFYISPNEPLNDSYQLYDFTTEKDHTFYIHSIELYDVHAEMMKQFEDERYKALPKEDFDMMKEMMESHYPKDKKMVLVKYEIEEDFNLHFYSKDFLDEPVERSSSSMGLIMSPDEKIGPHGLHNRVCPVISINEDDFDDLEIELLTYTKTT